MCVYIGMRVWKALCRCTRERVHVLYVCILAPLFTLCGTVSGDSDLFLSRLINEEIKVSVSQSRHKDTGRGIRHPAGTSEILISPSLYFPSTARHCGWLFSQWSYFLPRYYLSQRWGAVTLVGLSLNVHIVNCVNSSTPLCHCERRGVCRIQNSTCFNDMHCDAPAMHFCVCAAVQIMTLCFYLIKRSTDVFKKQVTWKCTANMPPGNVYIFTH